MGDKIITTLPIKPQEKIKIGLCIAPLLSEVLRNSMDAKNIFSVNLLNTYDYKDNVLKNYLNKIKSLGINYDELYIDKDNSDKLIKCIQEMIKRNVIVEKETPILRCKCCRIETPIESIREYDDKALYYEKDGKLFCKICNEEAKLSIEKALFLHLDKDTDTSIKIFPEYLKNACENFDKQYKGKDYLITKKRNTGYSINYNGTNYNIDIDALWMNYINCFNSQEQVIIASNHQLFEMYLMNYINKMYNNKDLHFIATPYLVSKNKKLDEQFEKMRPLEVKLNLLFSLKWKTPDSTFNENAEKYLKSLDDEELEKLYYQIQSKTDKEDTKLQIKDVLLNNINFQKALKKANALKKLQRTQGQLEKRLQDGKDLEHKIDTIRGEEIEKE